MTRTRHLLLLAFGLTLVACGAALQDVEVLGEPILHQGRVIAARGPTMARVGDTCTVEVMRTDGSYLNCRIRVRCHDDLVYGLSGAGYNHCRVEGDELVFAQDTTGTRRDGDPRLYFDLRAGRVIISDDDPDVEVLVDLLMQPPGYAPSPEPSAPESSQEPSPEPSQEPS